MNRVARRSAVLILLILILAGGFGFFLVEYCLNAGSWVLFPGSPHVYHGGNIGAGVVVDRSDTLLLNLSSGRIYSTDETLRRSTVHWVGDRYGSISAPALPNYSGQIVDYSILNGLYAYGDTASVCRMTLSAAAQNAALEALQGKKGTVAVYNYRTGELLCAVTSPTYDPDNVPDLSQDTEGIYEGMYLNRFTQAAYTPGSIFKIVTLAAALEQLPDIRQEQFQCTGSYTLQGGKVTCETSHGTQNLKDAFCNSCNCVFAQLSQRLGAETIARYARDFGLTEQLRFDGVSTAKGRFDIGKTQADVAWSAIGQYTDLINPCSFMTLMGAIAGGGSGAVPHVISQIRQPDGELYQAKTEKTGQLMSAETAAELYSYLRYTVQNKYGDENFPGLTVCAKTGTAELDNRSSTAMLAGFVADEQYPLAFIICVEEGGYGRATCVPIASKVLAVCKAVLDAE